MISKNERMKRQIAYEIAKKNSELRGVALTPETEALMAKYVNGDIGDQEFFASISKIVGAASSFH